MDEFSKKYEAAMEKVWTQITGDVRGTSRQNGKGRMLCVPPLNKEQLSRM